MRITGGKKRLSAKKEKEEEEEATPRDRSQSNWEIEIERERNKNKKDLSWWDAVTSLHIRSTVNFYWRFFVATNWSWVTRERREERRAAPSCTFSPSSYIVRTLTQTHKVRRFVWNNVQGAECRDVPGSWCGMWTHQKKTKGQKRRRSWNVMAPLRPVDVLKSSN